MRASTFFFLALFGGLFFMGHGRFHARHILADAVGCCHERPAQTVSERGASRASDRDARAAALESQVRALDRRGRDLDKSLQAVHQSARALQDMVRRNGDGAIRAELTEIESGERRLRDLRNQVEAEKVALSARVHLVRAGLDLAPAADSMNTGHTSPVDALAGVVVPPRGF